MAVKSKAHTIYQVQVFNADYGEKGEWLAWHGGQDIHATLKSAQVEAMVANKQYFWKSRVIKGTTDDLD